MRIAEVFHSVQGEGEFAGTASVFVRTTGCNLRCWFCDARYTSWEPEGEHVDVGEIVERVSAYDCDHVVVTGGEPLLPREIVELTEQLSALGRFVTIETAATVDRPVAADLMSISPKLANSTPADSRWGGRHEATRDRPEVVRRFVRDYLYQIKFVVDAEGDLDEVRRYLDRFPTIDAERVFLMPQATTRETLNEKTGWLSAAADELGVRFSPRLQVERFGNVRGT